jgi:hypothetical protein
MTAEIVAHPAFITHTSAFPPRDAPELCLNDPPEEGVALPQGGSGECRVPVAPAAACAKCSK